jgi:CDP-paratose 2-epimerase
MKYALITGSAGLIGSQSVDFFIEKGYNIIGVDNDMRSYFFGEEASTKKSMEKLISKHKNYQHYSIDIRDYNGLEDIFKKHKDKIEIIIHTAAQPSHDWACKEPLTDFTINANGTLNLLELTRLYTPKSTFIFTSTNKVYGDTPNKSPYLQERLTRWECVDDLGNPTSIDEHMSIDNTKHSIFGASKVAADIMCQEYGKYFKLNVGVFRGGCLTGPNHAGTELHGFLSYLVKCIINNKPYTIFGYKGKQVRDNIHSWDLVNMFWNFHQNPKKGEVYNAGGGRDNSISILEAIDIINKIAGTNWSNYTISEDNRIGDHIWYISDLSKFKKDYPKWEITHSITNIIEQMVKHEYNKQSQL